MQRRHDLLICNRQRKGRQLVKPNPAPILAADGLRRPGHMARMKGVQRDAEVGVGVLDRREEIAYFDIDRQFLVDLAAQACGQIDVAGFQLAARKFPQPTQHPVGRALRQQ